MPVDPRHLLGDLRGRDGLTIVLRARVDPSRRQSVEGRQEKLGTQPGKRALQLAAGRILRHRQRARKQDRPGVEGLFHQHRRTTRHRIAAQQGPGHRSRSTVERQERGVHVHGGHRRKVQEPARQDLAVGDDDQEIGPERLQERAIFLAPYPLGLVDRQTPRERAGLDRGRRSLLTSACGPIGLGDDGRDFVGAVGERLERGERELRSPQEDDAHATAYHSPALAILRILLRMRFRLSALRRSTKSMPLRWSIS